MRDIEVTPGAYLAAHCTMVFTRTPSLVVALACPLKQPTIRLRIALVTLLVSCAGPQDAEESFDESVLVDDVDDQVTAAPGTRTSVIWGTGFERPKVSEVPWTHPYCGPYTQKRVSTATEFVGWEYKTPDGYLDFPTDLKFRGNNALQVTYPAVVSPPCDGSNKSEIATLNVLSEFEGKYVYGYGYTRYTGFAFRFGDSLNPASQRYFGNTSSYSIFAQIRQDSAPGNSPIIDFDAWGPLGTSDTVFVRVRSRSGAEYPYQTVNDMFSFRVSKAEWHSVVLESTISSPVTGKVGEARLWLDGKAVPVALGSGDVNEATRYQWDGYIGQNKLAEPTNNNSGLFFDIYRPREAVAQTVFIDNVRVTAASNDRPSFEARMLADPRKLGRRAGSDVDGDGISDRLAFSGGRWSMLRSSGGSVVESQFGGPGDKPLAGDYDGDGLDDRVVFRPGNGTWYIRYGNGKADSAVAYGWSTDKPVRGDFDGDGVHDRAVYRPATGEWWVLRSSDGVNARLGAFGFPTDLPMPGDYDGDARTDMAVWRPSNGTWYMRPSRGGADVAIQYGTATDLPVAADYDGDGKTDRMIFRAGAWYLVSSATGARSQVGTWGLAGDIPAAGDYDGDGKVDLAIYRSSTATFWIIQSSNGHATAIVVGSPGASVVPSPQT